MVRLIIDPKLDRDNKKLVFNDIWFDPGIAKGKGLIQELACTFSRFAAFLDDFKDIVNLTTIVFTLRDKTQ